MSLTSANDTHHHLHSSLGGILCPESSKTGVSEGTDVCNAYDVCYFVHSAALSPEQQLCTPCTSFLVAGVAPLPAPDHGLAAPAAKEAACSVFVPCVWKRGGGYGIPVVGEGSTCKIHVCLRSAFRHHD